MSDLLDLNWDVFVTPGIPSVTSDLPPGAKQRLWPPITSIMAGPPPLNGTCTMSTPAISLKSSVPRCWKLPDPADA